MNEPRNESRRQIARAICRAAGLVLLGYALLGVPSLVGMFTTADHASKEMADFGMRPESSPVVIVARVALATSILTLVFGIVLISLDCKIARFIIRPADLPAEPLDYEQLPRVDGA
jgi:hypothetical protein